MNSPKSYKELTQNYEYSSPEDKILSLTESPLQKAKRINEQISIDKVKYLINNSLTKKCSPKNYSISIPVSGKETNTDKKVNPEENNFCSAFDRIQLLTSGKKDHRSPFRWREKQHSQAMIKY